jgi:hypothetical protein
VYSGVALQKYVHERVAPFLGLDPCSEVRIKTTVMRLGRSSHKLKMKWDDAYSTLEMVGHRTKRWRFGTACDEEGLGHEPLLVSSRMDKNGILFREKLDQSLTEFRIVQQLWTIEEALVS